MKFPVPSLDIIEKRLPLIFPDGITDRNNLIRNIAVKTIFVHFYVNAIEGEDCWLRPDQVTKMGEAQSRILDREARSIWAKNSIKPGSMKDVPDRWFASNTRESIRDETIRALKDIGAIITLSNLPTTSSKPRYALSKHFAELLLDEHDEASFLQRCTKWQEESLSSEALARIRITNRSAGTTDRVLVTLPNGETRSLSPGPSSLLTKDTLEIFCKRFLKTPALIFLSESGNKVVSQDDKLAKDIGLRIQPDLNLPDIILADIGSKSTILIFTEIVHSDGPINEMRKKALLDIAVNGGFNKENIVFLTVFHDRSSPAYRKVVSSLAWGSFVWFAAEPDNIIVLRGKPMVSSCSLKDLLS
jgi:hypothetical protein